MAERKTLFFVSPTRRDKNVILRAFDFIDLSCDPSTSNKIVIREPVTLSIFRAETLHLNTPPPPPPRSTALRRVVESNRTSAKLMGPRVLELFNHRSP